MVQNAELVLQSAAKYTQTCTYVMHFQQSQILNPSINNWQYLLINTVNFVMQRASKRDSRHMRVKTEMHEKETQFQSDLGLTGSSLVSSLLTIFPPQSQATPQLL